MAFGWPWRRAPRPAPKAYYGEHLFLLGEIMFKAYGILKMGTQWLNLHLDWCAKIRAGG